MAGAVLVCSALLFVPNELWKRWRVRLVDRLDYTLQRRVSRFKRRYQDFVLSGLRFIDLKGLTTVGFYTPELGEVFVDVSLVHRPPHQVPEGVVVQPPGRSTVRRSIGDFLDHPQPTVVAVIGAPGSGKTTLLRHTARVVCRERRSRRRTVPILLYLRDHIATIVSTPDVSLPTLLRGTLGRYAPTEPPGWLEQRLEAGECIVLLDGLDEVSKQEQRRTVADWIERLVQQYPQNDYVITSRPHGYRTASIDGAVVLQVQSFTDDQVTRFVRGWYLAVERHGPGSAEDDIELRAEAAADDLLKRLHEAEGLYELTVNPLLLTMIANVHRYRGALPGSRADLYSEICQVMLWRRQEAKKLPTVLGGNEKETLLRSLAFSMMQRRVRDLPRAEVIHELRSARRRTSITSTVDEFLTEVCSYGLIVERESGVYAFAHLTFQESLAASHIRAKNLVDLLVDAVDDPWWRETTLLYAAQSDADPIVAACLDVNSVTALSMAFDCAEQGSDLAPGLRGRLHDLLDDDQTDAERRRLNVAVQVTRHLRDLIRIGNGRVCARPISNRIYQMYMEDTGGCAPDGPSADKDEPVVGVRASDASAFVRWVNEITGGEPEYRLPNRLEIDDPAIQRSLARLHPELHIYPWLQRYDDIDRPSLWRPHGSVHPNRVTAGTLGLHLRGDVNRLAPVLQRLLVIKSAVEIRKYASADGVSVASDLLAIAGDGDRALAHDLMLDHDIDRDLTNVLDTLRRYKQADHTLPIYKKGDLTWLQPWEVTELAAEPSDARVVARQLPDDLVDPKVHSRALSQALSRAFVTASWKRVSRADETPRWQDAFHDEFVDLSGIAPMRAHSYGRPLYDTVVSIDGLADHVRDACTTLTDATPTIWVRRVTSRLSENALAVFEQQQPLTPEKATSVRLAALCLAAEADARGARLLGNTFRGIAAGITLLERRATGQSPVTETILLAPT